METNLYDLDNVKYEYEIINTLKSELGNKVKSVISSYPDDNKSFPLIVTSLYDNPIRYDASKNELLVRLRININLWANTRVETISILQEVEKIMNEKNFTRLSKTELIKDQSNNKFFIKEVFNINFNRINGNLERAI